MFETIVKELTAGRMFARQEDRTLAKLRFTDVAFVSPNKERYKIRAKLPCGTRCEVTQDSSVCFTCDGKLPPHFAYAVLA